MSSIKVTFVEPDGTEKTLETSKLDQSVMELARGHGIAGITADCGGGCSCATCHVYVDAKWQAITGSPDEIESEVLDMHAHVHQSNSRLSCQIKLRPELNGLRVTVATQKT